MSGKRLVCSLTGLVPSLAAVLCGVTSTGCWDTHPCDPDQIDVGGTCAAAPSPPVAGDGGGRRAQGGTVDDGGAGEGGPAASHFGDMCTTSADCSGDAPFCAQPFAPLCTQQNCAAGEANAGACPAVGWQCVMIPGAPSVCVKM
ncbi:MAG: hypothetical protein JOZ69_17035 [Myxococcales bacterium]|nr:hypothetical protein [Myxococcales bacterium]